MQKTSRRSHRSTRNTSIEMEAGSQSYFQWREQTVRMPAVTPSPQPSQPGPIVRLFRRITGKV